MAHGLHAPENLKINFSPSIRQYEVWKNLQPECPKCGGEVVQEQVGVDRTGHPQYKSVCKKCGETNIPQIILCGGSAGGGKALLLDSHVLTPFGFRKLRDIKVGDIITSPTTGGMQKVVYLHPIGVFDFYRIKFRDGTYTDCSEGHLWQLHQSRKHKSKKAEKYNLSTDEVWPTIKIYEWYQKKDKGMYNGQNLIIPLPEPVKFTVANRWDRDHIDPYIFGAIIGDGCITDSVLESGYVQFTTMDQEIVDRFIACGYDMSNKRQKTNVAYAYNIKDDNLIAYLKKVGVAGNNSHTHFIPKTYKYGSIEDRIKLMQGLMDTDGYVDERGHMSYTSTSEQLAEDVAFIVRSLGGVATITSDMGSYRDANGEKHICNKVWTVYFRTKMDPDLCGLTRKKSRASYDFNGGNSEYGKRIIGIDYIGKKEGRCISVSEPNGLYIADDFTVTHNSYLGSCWLVSSCLRWPDMRMVVGRKTLKSLRESTWNTIVSVVKSWGLVEYENYKINNLSGEMIFWNDSRIIMKEMAFQPADPEYLRFGSSEFSGAFVDEVGEIDQKAVDVLFSRIRWNVANTFHVPKLLMSTNPCLGWVRDRFVIDENGDAVVCKENEMYIPFSVWDNPDEHFRTAYVSALYKISDPSVRERLLFGNWLYVDVNVAAAYWKFSGEKHLVMNLKEKVYDPLKPIILSFDFNVIPFMSCLAFQVDYDKKKVYVLEEILGRPEDKENNTPRLAQKIKAKYLNEGHMGGLFVTGDPAGLARSTQTEDGINNYTIILKNLESPVLRPKQKILSKQPPQIRRLEFVNALFSGYDGWEVMIDLRCRKFTEDLVYQKKNADGTKCKTKGTDNKTGVKYEKYGHLSDCFDYFCCGFLNNSWNRFRSMADSGITTVNMPIYDTFEY